MRNSFPALAFFLITSITAFGANLNCRKLLGDQSIEKLSLPTLEALEGLNEDHAEAMDFVVVSYVRMDLVTFSHMQLVTRPPIRFTIEGHYIPSDRRISPASNLEGDIKNYLTDFGTWIIEGGRSYGTATKAVLSGSRQFEILRMLRPQASFATLMQYVMTPEPGVLHRLSPENLSVLQGYSSGFEIGRVLTGHYFEPSGFITYLNPMKGGVGANYTVIYLARGTVSDLAKLAEKPWVRRIAVKSEFGCDGNFEDKFLAFVQENHQQIVSHDLELSKVALPHQQPSSPPASQQASHFFTALQLTIEAPTASPISFAFDLHVPETVKIDQALLHQYGLLLVPSQVSGHRSIVVGIAANVLALIEEHPEAFDRAKVETVRDPNLLFDIHALYFGSHYQTLR